MITSMNEYFVTTLLNLFNMVLVTISVTNHVVVKEYETSNHAYLCYIHSQDPLNQIKMRKNAHDTAVRLVKFCSKAYTYSYLSNSSSPSNKGSLGDILRN